MLSNKLLIPNQNITHDDDDDDDFPNSLVLYDTNFLRVYNYNNDTIGALRFSASYTGYLAKFGYSNRLFATISGSTVNIYRIGDNNLELLHSINTFTNYISVNIEFDMIAVGVESHILVYEYSISGGLILRQQINCLINNNARTLSFSKLRSQTHNYLLYEDDNKLYGVAINRSNFTITNFTDNGKPLNGCFHIEGLTNGNIMGVNSNSPSLFPASTTTLGNATVHSTIPNLDYLGNSQYSSFLSFYATPTSPFIHGYGLSNSGFNNKFANPVTALTRFPLSICCNSNLTSLIVKTSNNLVSYGITDSSFLTQTSNTGLVSHCRAMRIIYNRKNDVPVNGVFTLSSSTPMNFLRETVSGYTLDNTNAPIWSRAFNFDIIVPNDKSFVSVMCSVPYGVRQFIRTNSGWGEETAHAPDITSAPNSGAYCETTKILVLTYNTSPFATAHIVNRSGVFPAIVGTPHGISTACRRAAAFKNSNHVVLGLNNTSFTIRSVSTTGWSDSLHSTTANTSTTGCFAEVSIGDNLILCNGINTTTTTTNDLFFRSCNPLTGFTATVAAPILANELRDAKGFELNGKAYFVVLGRNGGAAYSIMTFEYDQGAITLIQSYTLPNANFNRLALNHNNTRVVANSITSPFLFAYSFNVNTGITGTLPITGTVTHTQNTSLRSI